MRGREVLGEQGEFGEGQGEQVVKLVEQTGALADDRLQPAGDLAQGAEDNHFPLRLPPGRHPDEPT